MNFSSLNKEYKNPFRQGVLIGNYSEDMFGKDHQLKHHCGNATKTVYETEAMAQFKKHPVLDIHRTDFGNDMTMKHNSNFDLNIDFENLKNCSANQELTLKNKNNFNPNQVMSLKSSDDELTKNIQAKLYEQHLKESKGLLFTKKSGLVKNLFFGHSLNHRDMNYNEYASTYE